MSEAAAVEVAESRKVSKLSFMPAMTPDAIIVKSFHNNHRPVAPPPFPRLHPTVDQERAHSYLAQKEEERRRRPPPIIAIPPPTTVWFPEKPKAPVLGKPLAPNLPTSLSSPSAQERAASRSAVYQNVLDRLGGPVPTNCKLLYSCVCAEMNEKGFVSAVQLTRVFQDVFQVQDISHVDNFFQLIDTRRKGFVGVLQIIAAVDTILNGSESEAVRRACFEPFNLEGRGYIHKANLIELKHTKEPLERDPIRTPEMVKVLTDLFLNEIVAEEEEAYLVSLSKGKKGKKKKAPPLKANQKSIIPVERARVTHMNFDTFSRYFTESKTLAGAFARCWLPLVEENSTLRLLIVQRVQDLMDG